MSKLSPKNVDDRAQAEKVWHFLDSSTLKFLLEVAYNFMNDPYIYMCVCLCSMYMWKRMIVWKIRLTYFLEVKYH